MTLSALILALQMMFGSANVATTPDGAIYQAQQAGIVAQQAGIIVTDQTIIN